MKNDQGMWVHSFQHLASLGTSHFWNLYRDPHNASLEEIIRVVCLFPRSVDQDDDEDFLKPLSMGELESTLKWFKKDKSPGPDGWHVQFYTAFFDVLAQYLLKIIEDCRTASHM